MSDSRDRHRRVSCQASFDSGWRCGFTGPHCSGMAMAFNAPLIRESLDHTSRKILHVESNYAGPAKEPQCKYNCTRGWYRHIYVADIAVSSSPLADMEILISSKCLKLAIA